MASSGSVRTAHTPATTAKAVAIDTSIRFFADQAMRRAIIAWPPSLDGAVEALERGLQIAFRIDEEVAVDDHSVALGYAADDLDEAITLTPKLDVTRFIATVTLVEQHNLPAAAIDDGARGTATTSSSVPVAISTSAYMSGSNARSGFGNSMRTRTVRVSFIRCG